MALTGKWWLTPAGAHDVSRTKHAAFADPGHVICLKRTLCAAEIETVAS